MKLPPGLRNLSRRALGMGRAEPIAPEQLASLDDALVIGVGLVRDGALDARLPGEQRTASLLSLARVVADVPKQRPIVLHCG